MISIIIPVYNAEPYLARCIDSVLASPYGDFEIILVNDGSSDGSLKICARYAEKDSRVRLFTQENQGVSSARNRGIAQARGEWIIFLDADDFISGDFLTLTAGETYRQTDLLLFHFALHVFDDSRVFASAAPADANAGVTVPGDSDNAAPVHSAEPVRLYRNEEMLQLVRRILVPSPLEEGLSADFRTPCARAYKRDIIERFSIRFSPDIRIGEDLLFNLEYQLRAKSCAYIPRTVYYYDIHGDSSSHHFNPELRMNHARLLGAVRSALDRNGLFSVLEKEFHSYALENLSYVLIREIFNPLSPRKYRENRRLCLELRREGLYRESLRYNRTCGILPRRVLLAFFRMGCCPLAALISRVSYVYLEHK